MLSTDRRLCLAVLIAAGLFAATGAATEFGAPDRYHGILLHLTEAFAVLGLAGFTTSARRHRDFAPLIVAGLGYANVAYHFYWEPTLAALIGGLLGVIAAAIWNQISARRTGDGPIP
jgi:glycerol uptake facilitator-like aquaporin